MAQDVQSRLKALGNGERVVGVASVVVLLGMFLPWVSLSGSCSGAFCAGGGSTTAVGNGFNDWGLLTFLGLLAVIAYFVVRTFLRDSVQLPSMPLSAGQLYMVGGALEVAGVLLFWLGHLSSFGSATFGPYTLSSGLAIGWFFSLLGGAATIVGGYMLRSTTPVVTATTPPPSGVPPAQ